MYHLRPPVDRIPHHYLPILYFILIVAPLERFLEEPLDIDSILPLAALRIPRVVSGSIIDCCPFRILVVYEWHPDTFETLLHRHRCCVCPYLRLEIRLDIVDPTIQGPSSLAIRLIGHPSSMSLESSCQQHSQSIRPYLFFELTDTSVKLVAEGEQF